MNPVQCFFLSQGGENKKHLFSADFPLQIKTKVNFKAMQVSVAK